MKVLHLVAGELTGGAARGAYWLHLGLRRLGVHSTILTNSSITFGDDCVFSIGRGISGRLMCALRRRLEALPPHFYFRRQPGIFSSGLIGFDFTRTMQFREADVVHLHWINEGLVNMRHLRTVEKPVVWTMRDMWPMTGGCHYSMGCEGYRRGCGRCDQLRSGHHSDWSRLVLARKQKFLPKQMTLVGISKWLSEKAREIPLFRDVNIRTISNNVDTQVFLPVEKTVAREALRISTVKKVVLFGGADLKSAYKGYGKMLEALAALDSRRYFVLSFGSYPVDAVAKLGFQTRNFGYVHDNALLRLIYSASDVYIAPSIMEAFGKTLAEAMACGTPVVCFDATGPKDIVTHKQDGYKARPFDPQDFADGIEWICGSENYHALCRVARDKVVRLFDNSVIARHYLDLYTELVDAVRVSGKTCIGR